MNAIKKIIEKLYYKAFPERANEHFIVMNPPKIEAYKVNIRKLYVDRMVSKAFYDNDPQGTIDFVVEQSLSDAIARQLKPIAEVKVNENYEPDTVKIRIVLRVTDDRRLTC